MTEDSAQTGNSKRSTSRKAMVRKSKTGISDEATAPLSSADQGVPSDSAPKQPDTGQLRGTKKGKQAREKKSSSRINAVSDPESSASGNQDLGNGALTEKSLKSRTKQEAMRDWLMIILGLVLIIFAALNLLQANPLSMLREMRVTPPVDQAGFAPIFIPRTTVAQIQPAEVSTTNYPPDRIVIDKIGLDAPVNIAQSINVSVEDQDVTQFLVPEEFAAGWHEGSAPLGVPGNTVISGHHNAYGEVFKDLVELETGDIVTLLSSGVEFNYIITNKMILSEKNEPLEVRVENGRWILPSDDERLTLVTCWPEYSNTHRLILVSVPVEGTNPSPGNEPTEDPTISQFQRTPALYGFESADSIPTTGNITGNFEVVNSEPFPVNIREAPSIRGEIVGSLKGGHSAVGLGRTALGDWILIRTNDTSGWVSAELVEVHVPVDLLPTTQPTITASQ